MLQLIPDLISKVRVHGFVPTHASMLGQICYWKQWFFSFFSFEAYHRNYEFVLNGQSTENATFHHVKMKVVRFPAACFDNQNRFPLPK